MEKIFSVILVGFALLFLTRCKKDHIISERCNLEPDAGLCKAYIPKYYYDKKDKKCKQFIWGGCDGVVPFETLVECENRCDCK